MHCPSRIQSGVYGRSAFTHFHILLKLFLQPQWTSSLKMTAAASSVTHCGCSCSFLPRVQPQFGGSGRTGLRAVACSPHVSSLIDGALQVLVQSVTSGWESFQLSPFLGEQVLSGIIDLEQIPNSNDK